MREVATTQADLAKLAQRLRAALRSLNEQAGSGELTEPRFRAGLAAIRSVAEALDAQDRAQRFGGEAQNIGADVIEIAKVLARRGVRAGVPDFRGCRSDDLRLSTLRPVRPAGGAGEDDGGAA